MKNTLNKGQRTVFDFIVKGMSVFITGNAGSGKSYVIEVSVDELRRMGKKVVVTASTGMAAQNYDGGRTIHSLTSYRPGFFQYDYSLLKHEFIEADVIVVDEVSMLDRNIMKHLHRCLREKAKPTQLIFAGDFYQLPPVYRKEKIKMYPFELNEWRDFSLVPFLLTECMRQKDVEFIYNLDKLKLGDISCIPYFETHTADKEIPGAITICARKNEVNRTNRAAIDELKRMTHSRSMYFLARGDIDNADFTKTNVEKNLEIVKGMRVMILRNDSAGRYHNGSLGTVVDANEEYISVKLDNKNIVQVGRVTYHIDNKDTSKDSISVEQFPIRAGYAVTIHKSQGQTFDRVNIKALSCWDAGQFYVAMSRCKSVENIYLAYSISEDNLITDPRVVEYYKSIKGCSAS